MRPLVHFDTRTSSRPYAIALIAVGLVSGCCQGGSSTDPNAQPNANPPASAPVSPVPNSSSSETALAPSAPVMLGPTEAPPGPPPREIAGAAHILVAFKGAENAPKTITRSKEDARKRAEEALKELKKDESKFGELVKKYSDDPISKATDGRLGNFERNVMPPTFSDVCFAMKVDAISDVVETQRGFHIIKRTK